MPCQHFHFVREPHGAREIVTQRDDAVMRKQARTPVLQRLERMIREQLCAKERIGAQRIESPPAAATM